MVRIARPGTVLVLLLLGLLLVAPSASPIQLGYVDSGSMAPTLEPGDGYVAVPAGEVTEGEIVVFWSSNRGGFVTHRVVGQTDEGFITKGDANDVTDQSAGYPPIPRSAIVASVFTIGGTPLVIPALGSIVAVVNQYRVLALALLLLVGAILVVRERVNRRSTRPQRAVVRVGDVIEPLFLVGIVTFVAITPLGAAVYQVTYVASADPSGGSTIPIGESVTRTISVDAPGRPLTAYVTEAEGMTIVDRRFEGATMHLDVSLSPPEQAGPQLTAVSVYPYPAVLPQGLLQGSHDVHPILAILASAGVVFGPLFVLYRLLLDRRRPLFTTRRGVGRLLGGG